MNVLMLLTPKSEVRFLKDTATVRAALETMKHHGYTALPVVTGLNAGHVAHALTVPLGRKARLDAGAGRLFVI